MKKLLVTTIALLLASAASAATLNEKIDKTFDVKPGATVVLSNVNGAIKISSWDQPRVRVLAEKEVEGDRDDIKAAMKELRVEMQPKDGGLVITTHYPKESQGTSSIFSWLMGDDIDAEVTYELMIPRSMSVDVTNTNGSIRLAEVSGKLELDTTNGKIEVTRCAGSIDASTTNGSIHAELVKIAKGQPLRFETTNGRISVAVPSDFAGDIDAGTTNGSIDTDFPVTTTKAGGNSLRGSVNGGGTPLRLRTTNGSIDIKKAS
ncbi:MAG: hypothetical protein QOH21_2888 [Acidobacteriota bacterium]|jgi:hypothetical protein|nr:hypothetical protein [Acidobacteriota bacterium]